MERSGCVGKGCEWRKVEGTVGCVVPRALQPQSTDLMLNFIWQGWILLLWEPPLAIPPCCAPSFSFRAGAVTRTPPQCVVWWVGFSIKPGTNSIQSLPGTGSDVDEAGGASGQTQNPWQHSMGDSDYTSQQRKQFFPLCLCWFSLICLYDTPHWICYFSRGLFNKNQRLFQ